MSNLYKEILVGDASKYEHRVIAEKLINRKLKQEEVVHHKDNNKSNNSEDNLIIFVSRGAHVCFHHGGTLIPTSEKYVYDCNPVPKNCVVCGKELQSHYTKTKMCVKCLAKKQRKVQNRPTHEELKKLLSTNSYCAVGKMYGVSDNTIRKWLKTPE